MLVCVDVSQGAQRVFPGFGRVLDRHHGKNFAGCFYDRSGAAPVPLKVAWFMDLTYFRDRPQEGFSGVSIAFLRVCELIILCAIRAATVSWIEKISC